MSTLISLHDRSNTLVLLFSLTGSLCLLVFFFLLILGHGAPRRRRLLLLVPDLLGGHVLLLHLLLLGLLDSGLSLNFVLTAVVATKGEAGGATGLMVHFH